MAAAPCVLLLLLPALLCAAQALVKPIEITEEEGKEVTFPLQYTGPRTEVVWKIGEDKLVEVDERDPPHYYRLADRASISLNPGDLTIRRLVASDSGDYSGSYLNEGKYHETKFILKVSPSKPVVHYNVTEQKKVNLYCHSNSTGVTYAWTNSSGEFLSSEPEHKIDKEKMRTNESLICTVRNNHADINSTLTINLPASPKPGNTAAYWALLLLVIPVGVVFYCYKKRMLLCQKRKDKRVSGDNPDKPGNPAEGERLNPDGDAGENGKTPGKPEGE